MDISLDTFLKPEPAAASEIVGRTRLSLDEGAYRQLFELEEKLKERATRELLVDAEECAIDVNAPQEIGDLKEPQVRVFLDKEGEAGHFHLVATRASDDALVYTEPTMIRLMAV